VPAWADAVVLGVLAAVIGLIANTGPSVWTDEAATLSAIHRSWGQLVALVQHIDLVHFTYYSMLRLWAGVFGESFASLRAFSAVAIGVATGALVVIGRLAWSRLFGIIAGVVFLALPVTDYMALDARSPALSTALMTTAIAMALAATRSQGRRARWYWIAYAVIGLLATAVFVYSVLGMVALGIALIVARVPRAARNSWMLATGILVVLAGAFLAVLRRESGQVAWIPPLSKDTVRAVLLTQFFRDEKYFLLVVGALFLIGVVQLVRHRRQRFEALDTVVLGLALTLFPLLALLLASIVFQPVYVPHYLGFTAPGLAILIAAVLMFALQRWMAVVALLIVVAFGIIAFHDEREPAAAFGSDWQAAANALARASRPGDAVAFRVTYGQDARGIKSAYPAAFAELVDPGPRVSPAASASLSGKEPYESDIHPKDGRLWLVVEQPGPKAPSISGYHLVSNRLVGWVGITLFEANR
jgi:mannosyltransferase